MARKLSLVFLAIASPVMLVLFFMPWPFAEVLFTLLVMGYPVALIVVAVGRREGVRRHDEEGGVRIRMSLALAELSGDGFQLFRIVGNQKDRGAFARLPRQEGARTPGER